MKKISIKDITLISMLLCLLIIGSKITIPLGIISLTMQLPMVFIILFIAPRYVSIITIALYLFMGLIGLPVFSSGGGITYLLKPSFGFIIGFLVAAIFTPRCQTKIGFVISIMVALLIVYGFGAIYMYVILNYYMDKNVSVLYVLNAGVFPFIVKDIICAYISSVVAYRVRNIGYLGQINNEIR